MGKDDEERRSFKVISVACGMLPVLGIMALTVWIVGFVMRILGL